MSKTKIVRRVPEKSRVVLRKWKIVCLQIVIRKGKKVRVYADGKTNQPQQLNG